MWFMLSPRKVLDLGFRSEVLRKKVKIRLLWIKALLKAIEK